MLYIKVGVDPDPLEGRAISRLGRDDPSVGKYKLIKTIGKGNFAKVKLAKHVPTDKEVHMYVRGI